MRKLLLLPLILAFSGVPGDVTAMKPEKDIKIISNHVSYGHKKAETRQISSIIIHSSYNALDVDTFSVKGVLKEYENYGVSAHYLIDRQGNIYQLVKDSDIAYHAGRSRLPNGDTNVNASSIGIELVNTMQCGPNETQYDSLNGLIDELKSKYKIKYVLGHSDIAPGRKSDPWMFNWKKVKR